MCRSASPLRDIFVTSFAMLCFAMTFAFALSITSLMPSSFRGVLRLSGNPLAFQTADESRSFFGVFGPPIAGITLRLMLTWFLAKFVSSVPDMSRPRFSIVFRRSSALRTRTIDCLWRGIIGRPLFCDSLRASLSWNRRRRICLAISRISSSVSSMLSAGGS
uniref:Uncharacterized protein n=1 Tax=Anopheles christyi TaxID=43041 RepID=A0A182KJ09_9DIPT